MSQPEPTFTQRLADEDQGTRSQYQKGEWSNKVDFIFTCVSMAVGLGNFWRFPYICYENGGGAFLIPYVIVLLVLGRPMYYLDMAMGQYCGRSSVYMYLKLARGLVGVGITQMLINMATCSYYAYLLAISGVYMTQSFTFTLPWEICRPEWSNCVERNKPLDPNSSSDAVSSAQLYLDKVILGTLDTLDYGVGTPRWQLCISLAVLWVIACLNVSFGMKLYGKLVYILTVFPYIVIFALLIQSCLMPGAASGILFLVTPTWSKLISPSVWLSAVTQCFFSLNIGCGTIAMYSSYSNIHADIAMVSQIVSAVDTLTSVLCSLTMFAGLGNLAHRLGVPMSQVYKGNSLALGFVAYPDSISNFDTVPYVFAVLFFIMLCALGLGSLCAYMQVVTTNLLELTNMRSWQASMIISVLGYICGIVFTTPGGFGLLDLVDLFGNVYCLLVVAFCQVLVITHCHGLHRWCWNMEYMLGKRVSWYWRYTWAITCPIILLTVCLASGLANVQPLYHGKPYPIMALVAAYILLLIIIIPIPLAIIIAYVRYRQLVEKAQARELTFSTRNWYPDDETLVGEIRAFDEAKQAENPYASKTKRRQIFTAICKQP